MTTENLCLTCVCVCVYNERADLGVGDGQGVHPDAPAAPLVFDGVVQQDAEDGVHHLCDFLLLTVPRVDEAQREHPLLPHRALQQTPGNKKESHRWVNSAWAAVCDAVLHLVKRWNSHLRFSRLLLNSLIRSDRKTLRTSMLSGVGGEVFSSAAIIFRISRNTNTNEARHVRIE